MATTNTDYNYYYYIRKRGRNWYLGVIDNEGDAIATASLDIEIWYDALPDELEDKNDTLPIPRDAEYGFAMGCVYHLLLSMGHDVPRFKQMYDQTVYRLRHRQTQEAENPSVIKALNLGEN